MTNTMNDETQDTPTTSAGADETFAWSAEPEATISSGDKAREWLTQLQAMIENLATQAAPVIREVGAKAAELAANAGEKAGPVAQRAAELTGQAGQKIAERSRVFAADLRADQAEADAAIEAAKESTPAGVA
ncbi:MAG TPA: hypothetical protein VKC59_00745 [Candidatus Limnocylindrales bacterium]|nr:hypothetical protein [Candidatus Limnocylindrales bacterium]